eukprot:GEMP01109994.1.p1 GENE.GEMP01109994.1~~GEMP01109994.1.p1  ORF type:complete len:149 (+),score=30.46 GEMP01109994.1:172-618(+)
MLDTNTLCVQCGASAIYRCTRCGTRYCSKECQKLSWRDHRYVCRAPLVPGSVPEDYEDVRQVMRETEAHEIRTDADNFLEVLQHEDVDEKDPPPRTTDAWGSPRSSKSSAMDFTEFDGIEPFSASSTPVGTPAHRCPEIFEESGKPTT